MVFIELKFAGTEQISKQKPFEDSEFLYLTTDTIFGKKLSKVKEELKFWNIDEHHLGDAYFADAIESGDITIFSLRITYRSTPSLSKEENAQLFSDIIESFNVYLNEIKWLKPC
ncbi:MAG: hypothetical protein LLF83_03310 [Methanobacterium sp.]|nr:hypothetical protein [Methanobacterium sp.]